MAAFSRLQLAAALLEYDNDNPNLPHRSAHESAIFAPLRRNARPYAVSRKSDYLGVGLPSETGSVVGGESVLEGRKSRSSIGPLKNMFAGEAAEGDLEEEEEEEEAPDVDLASWGLDAFMSKEKEARKAKGKAKSLPSGQALQNVPSFLPHTDSNGGIGVIRRPKNGRSMSVGDYDFLTPMDNRRRQSIGSPLDLAGLEVPTAFQRPSPAVHDEPIPVGSIPFPTSSVRSPSPEAGPSRLRTYSNASMEPNKLLNDNRRSRLLSNGTMDITRMPEEDDNPFALRPPSRSSKFDPKAVVHGRTMSNASFGSRMLLENDAASVMTMNKRVMSNMDLLRPKVLVMPSPLQSAEPPPAVKGRDGFKVSADPPLPPGARSSRAPIASNSFTPNSSKDLTLSQMTFRSHLMVDGQRDISFYDGLPRALEDGEQVKLEEEEVPVFNEPVELPVHDSLPPSRPAGKLYGKSLIDDLENRKVQMKGKQRVFTGDDRPSMMKRGTLIDPESLRRPVSQTLGPGLSRRGSLNSQPLLNFDDERDPRAPSQQQLPQVRSVFGVDTLWEREMAKLKVIEAQEAAERERLEKEEAAKPRKKGKKGKKGTRPDNGVEEPSRQQLPIEPITPMEDHVNGSARVSDAAPVLPDIPTASSARRSALPANAPVIRGPPPVIDDNGSDSEESVQESRRATKAEGWHTSSEDEDDHPRRTTGVGLRYPNTKASLNRAVHAHGDDSDEDVPLSMARQRSTLRATLQAQGDESDEDKPLSVVLDKTRLNLPPVNFDDPQKTEDDDDDQPLGLRASRMISSSQGHEEDDVPLAFHPQQQLKSQHQMLQQQQMMQQQMMMQNSMFFNPSMSGFFPPPMMQPMLQVPVPMPSPPPVQDTAKLNRVDRWRHDVAIES